MEFKYFSHNGAVKALKEAVVPIGNIEYSYGFGVYETIRVNNGTPYFLEDHTERLMESARIIGLEHPFSEHLIEESIVALVKKNKAETCNIKLLLIGAHHSENAQLFMLCFNPLFPDRKLYREGADFITYDYKRPFPHAKTLNMLQSYLAYRRARAEGAYDALLLDDNGCIVEGTRTNFFGLVERTLISPPESEILLGVTRKALLRVANRNHFAFHEQPITWGDIQNFDAAFVTSTSSKIIPVRSVDKGLMPEFPPALRELMQRFDEFFDTCGGKMP